MAFSVLAYYYLLPPIGSLGPKPTELARLFVFAGTALFVWSLSAAQKSTTESLRRARDDLKVRVQEIQQSNEALQAESRERTQIENRLRRSEAYLAEAQRLTHTGSFGWNVQSGEIRWSDETFRIFECDPKTKLTLELVLQRIHPDDVVIVKQAIDRASQEQKDFDIEHRSLMPDGSIKYIHVVAHVLRDESGGIEFVGAVMDTTQSKRVEKELRRSEEFLLEAQKLSHTGSWRHDVTSGAVTVSPEIYRIHDIKREDDPSNTGFFFSRFHPDDRKRVVDVFERAEVEKTDFAVEYRIVLPAGTIKHLHTTGHPILNESGDLVEFVGTAMDVTAAKQAEESLRRSEGYLANAQRLTCTGSWAWNVATGQSVYWSQENYRLLGFDPEGGIPPDEVFYQRIHPEDRDRVRRETILERLDEGTHFDVDFRIVLPGGAIKYVRSTGHPVRNVSGDLLEYVGTSIDVTERKRADEERERLRQVEADLAHVNRVTTMGELTASLAHEVNQPLAASVTNANTCLRWLAGDTPNIEEARAAAMRIVKDGNRAAEIISRIRQLFKKGTSQRELVDVNEIIQEMIVLLRGETTRYNIFVATDLAADLPQVMADRVQLQQVLMNLMINGIEAMRDTDGKRELAIRSRRTQNEEVVLSVSDSGVGLPSQHTEQIFNAFFTTKPHGTGMGLRISRSIIESHDGRLWAADNSPRGTSFYFTLPTTAELSE